MTTLLDDAAWRDITQFWREFARIPQLSFEDSILKTVDALQALMRGSHVLVVVQMRINSAPQLAGFYPVVSRDFGPDREARLAITHQWASHEPHLERDPVLRKIVEGVGVLRLVRHQADTTPEAWSTAPTRRLLEQLKLADRVNVVIPVCPDVEVSFCVDRPLGQPAFDDRDREIILQVIDALVPLATNMVRFHGLMPGQHRLEDSERRVVELLLSPTPEEDVAETLGMNRDELHQVAEAIYAKLNVRSRLDLMHFWQATIDVSVSHQQELHELPRKIVTLPRPESGPLKARVREAVDRSIQAGDITLTAVARQMGMSERAFQRQLSEHDTSFTAMVDERREHLAKVLLALPWLTLTEIAMKLNYSQVSSFNRAVQRWTGRTPSDVRAELLEDRMNSRRSADEGA